MVPRPAVCVPLAPAGPRNPDAQQTGGDANRQWNPHQAPPDWSRPERTNRWPTTDQPPSSTRPIALGIDPVLLDKDPRGERIHGVVIENRHGRLQHNRSPIEVCGHQMHGRASHPDTVFERLALCVQAWERRQQRRVNIENALGKRIEQGRPDEAHEARQADQADIAGSEHVHEGAIPGVPVAVIARAEMDGFDACIARPAQPWRLSPVGDDNRDRRVKPPNLHSVDDRLEVRSQAGDQDPQAAIHGTSR